MPPMDATVISIPNEEKASPESTKRCQFPIPSVIPRQKIFVTRQVMHGFKVGLALAVVSLLYLVDCLYAQVGEEAMWAVITVVVIFEHTAGATLCKGLNRVMGTILGAGLAGLAAILAEQIGGIGEDIAVGTAVFFFGKIEFPYGLFMMSGGVHISDYAIVAISGALATFSRTVPTFRKRFDYGGMTFVLTFSLIIVSGIRAPSVINLARERVLTVIIGFVVVLFTSLFMFPVWASDDLHSSIASKFSKLACSIEGCLQEYFEPSDDKGHQIIPASDDYIAVLHSKTSDETLESFAKWEPWHGKFGFTHPWDKYLHIAKHLRELAGSTHSLKGCVQSPRQPSLPSRLSIKEPCQAVSSLLSNTMEELGDSIMKMKRSLPDMVAVGKLQKSKFELSEAMSMSKIGRLENDDSLAIASFVFLLMEMVDKVEVLANEVEELADLCCFTSK